MRWRPLHHQGTRVRQTTVLLALLALILPVMQLTAAPAEAAAQPEGARPGVVRGNVWYLRNTLSGGSADRSFGYGLAGDLKVVGDWNGDGTVTPGVVRGNVWYLRNSNTSGGADLQLAYGGTGDLPVVGDWNGDGIDTVGVVRGGTAYLRDTNSSGSANLSFATGGTGGLPVAGDWNGDGIDTLGMTTLATGNRWVLWQGNRAGSALTELFFGRPGDRPVVGDWDRNGTDTVGVTRGSSWYLRNSNSGGGADRSFGYGLAGDVPLVWEQVVIAVPADLRGTEWERLPTDRKLVALTFDAGANADGVPSILATLDAQGVPGTFFLTGQWTDQFPQEARAIGNRYPVGNHSQSHPDFTTLTDAQMRAQLDAAQTRILSRTGQDPRPLFRFPFGARDASSITVVNARGYGSIRWTVDTVGWRGTSGGQSVATVTDRVVNAARPGAIVLMHVGSHPQDGSTLDADALPGIIRELRARGYEFTTVRAFT